MGTDVPKQFLELGGVPLLVHSVRVLESADIITDIVLVVPEANRDYCLHEIVPAFGFKKVSMVLAGGPRRQDSVRIGVDATSPSAKLVLVHDAVRPFLTTDMIRSAVDGACKHGATVVAIPMRDTVKRVAQDGVVECTLDRSALWLAQTPQVFRRELLLDAHRTGERHGVEATDDAFLVEQLGHPVVVVNGSAENIKVTRPEDLIIGEAILARRTSGVPG